MRTKPYPTEAQVRADHQRVQRQQAIFWIVLAVLILAFAIFAWTNRNSTECHGDGYQTVCVDENGGTGG
jgi:hypothetical protein